MRQIQVPAWAVAGVIGLAAGFAQPASTANAAVVSFYDQGTGAIATSTGLRYDVGCFSDAALTTAVGCSGALLDVSLNNFDTNALDGLVGDQTDNANVDTGDPGNGVSPDEELLFVQNYVGDATLGWTGAADTTDAGGAASISFGTIAQYVIFTIGLDPRYGLLRNDSGAPLWISFNQVGQGAGLSHYGEFGVIPIPATLPLFLTGLLGLGFLGRRRRQMAEA